MFADDLVGATETEDAEAGGVDFEHLLFVVEDNSLAGGLKQGAEFGLRVAGGLLGALALDG